MIVGHQPSGVPANFRKQLISDRLRLEGIETLGDLDRWRGNQSRYGALVRLVGSEMRPIRFLTSSRSCNVQQSAKEGGRMSNLALDFDKPITSDCDPGSLAPAKLQTDCLFILNTYSGFAQDHNGRCPKAATDPNPHLTETTHHVRIGGSCLEVCEPCSRMYAKRADAIVRELAEVSR